MTKKEFIARYGEEAYQRRLEKNREYYRGNKDYFKEYYDNNKEKKSEYNKEYYRGNKDYFQNYREQNKEHIAECGKKYRENNKEHIAECGKKYRENNKEKIAEHYDNNKEKVLGKYVENGNLQVIENYELAKADNFVGWHCHHRLETHTSDGIRRTVNLSRAELKTLDMYYHRPANELIFMRASEHLALHRQKF